MQRCLMSLIFGVLVPNLSWLLPLYTLFLAAMLLANLYIRGNEGPRKLAVSPYKSKPKSKGSVAHYKQGLGKSLVCRSVSADNHWTV